MDEARSSPRFMAMQERLVVHLPGDAPRQEWVSVECATKEAYCCGKRGDIMLEGLTLYVRRLGSSDLNSSLAIGLSHLALESIQGELGVPIQFHGISGCLPEIDGSIRIVDQEVLVLLVIFRFRNHSKLVYYLVYDAKDASMYMIPYIPEDLKAIFTVTPVPARPAGGHGHELVLMARKFWPQRAERGRLCLCTPSTRANPDSTGPWAIKEHRFPDLLQAFSADVMFSFEDKVFWADLSQGVAYSNLRKGDSATFIKLPRGYLIDFSVVPMYAETEPASRSRTMGCIQGSVKFVCINRSVHHHPGYLMVRVWTLDLDHKQWKQEKGFPCLWKDLWKKVCDINSDMRYVVPPQPEYPILTPDGALSVVLPKTLQRRGGMEADRICSFDIVSKRCMCLGEVSNYHSIEPIILPSNFFNRYPAPLEQKLATPKRQLPSTVRDLKLPTKETKLPTPKRKLNSIVRQEPKRRPAFVQVVAILRRL
nr:unnamed protein product [Digitaria exilis]